MIERLAPQIALALAAAFFGIALYINVAEQPARLALQDGPLLAQWKISYKVGFMLQGSITLLAGLAALATWWFRRDWRWFVGGLLMLANWPWTLLVIAPINNALMATAPDAAGAASRALLEQWGQVHAGRTAFAGLAVVLFLWALAAVQRRTSLP
jgi:Domain of unknown function (DUF1772)